MLLSDVALLLLTSERFRIDCTEQTREQCRFAVVIIIIIAQFYCL